MESSDFDGFDRVAIIGLGLIGGSIALGLKQRGLASFISAFDRNRENLEIGLSLGVVDGIFDTVGSSVRDADMVVLAVPVKAMSGVLGELGPKAVITDVGSVKSPVIEAARQVFGEMPTSFVPGHPIAGSEKSGVRAATGDLFEGRRVILTPLKITSAEALDKVRSFWRAMGAELVEMEAAHHDEVLAKTSHLPHLLACALVDTLSRQDEGFEIFRYAAGGFRDFSRIAASDPVMWRDIFDTNADRLLEALDSYLENLARLTLLIRKGDTDGLQAVLARAKVARDHFAAMDDRRNHGAK